MLTSNNNKQILNTNMNNYYGNRLVKFVSPQCDKVFSLELGGEEMELKDLISTILNIPISDLKGIKDTYNNYYTFSSAIKNQQLTSSYSKYYTIVLGNPFNNQQYQLRQCPTNNYVSQPLEANKLKSNPMIYDQGSNCEQILNKLIKGNYIDGKSLQKINQLLTEENNQEMMMLFNNYNGYNLKILAEKILSIINHEEEKSNNNKSQLITYSDILDSLEDHFEDKKDITVLKKLLFFDNEHIIKVFQYYEESCDMLNLVDNLNQMVILYKDKFEDILYSPSDDINNNNKAKEDEENNKASDEAYEIAKAKAKQDRIKENYNELYQILSFELKAILVYAKKFNENYSQLFQIEKPIEEEDNKNKAVQLIQKFYDYFMEKNVYHLLKKNELETYHKILHDNSKNKEMKKAFEAFEEDFDVNDLKDKILKEIKEKMPQEKSKENALNTFFVLSEQKADSKTKVDKEDDYLINNNKKEKSTITLKYQNSTNVTSKQSGSVKENYIENESNNKKESDKLLSFSTLNNKKLQEFTKVINTLSIEDQYKTKVLQLLTDKDVKVIQIYENFLKNKMSLTKNVILNVVQSLNDDNNKNLKIEENKSRPLSDSNKASTNEKEGIPTSTSSFDSVIGYLEKEKVISPCESSFIKKRYQNNDEMILSIWEVFKASDGELPDFIDSLKTFIAKHHAKSITLPEPIGSKTPISITNTKKEILNLFRSNEKSEMNKIKNKQKQIISLLLKENLIESSNYDFFIMKIEAEDQIVSSVFEVFSVARDHRDFVETLNLIKDIMYNKDSVHNDPLFHQKHILNELFDKSNFNSNEREILMDGLMQNAQTILSAIELFEVESDVNEVLDTLEIYVKKKMRKRE